MRHSRGWHLLVALLAVVGWISGQPAAGQAAALALPPGTQHFGLDAGLPQRRITGLWQAPDGWLWVGTGQGLCRFDGVRFERIGPGNRPVAMVGGDARHRRVGVALVDGGLWLVSTATGAVQSVRRPDPLGTTPGSQRIRAFLTTRAGAFYAGTRAGWLLRYVGGGRFRRVVRVPAPAGSAAGAATWIVGLAEDARGDLWLSTMHNGGVYRYRPATGALRRYPDAVLPADAGNHALAARVGAHPATLEVAAILNEGPLLLRYDARADAFRPVPVGGVTDSASGYRMPSLLVDAYGRAWGGRFTESLYRFPDPAEAARPARDLSAALRQTGGVTTCLLPDGRDGLWVGTTNGLLHISEPPARFDTLLARPAATPASRRFSLRGLAELPDGRLLVSGYRGQHLLDLRTPGAVPRPLPGPGGAAAPMLQTYATLPDSGGRGAWVVGEGMGLAWLDLRTGTCSSRQPPDQRDQTGRRLSRHLRAVVSDGAGGLWLGSYDGLYHYTPSGGRGTGTFVRVISRRYPALAHVDCYVLARRGAELWAGGQEGLFVVDVTTGALRWVLPPGAAQLPVRAIWADPTGPTVWLGTGAGLVSLDARTHRIGRRVSTAQGLSHPVVNAIVPDTAGRLWISTDDGLDVLTPATGQVRVFRVEDGLSAAEFNHGSAVRLRSGELLFGSVNGLTRVGPLAPTPGAKRPVPLLLTHLSWQDAAAGVVRTARFGLRAGRHLTLGPRDEFFALGVALPVPDDPTRHRFAYRLDGLESGWSFAGGAPTIRYPRLPAGRYALWVRAATADGRWQPAQRLLDVRVLPPIYARWWFVGLVVLAVAGILTLVWRWREERLRQLERLRTRLAADLHDDVGALLTQISVESQLLSAGVYPVGEQAAHLHQLSEASRAAVRQMSDVVWSIDARNDTAGHLADRLRDYAYEVLAPAGLDVQFTIDEASLPTAPLPPQVRQHLYLIYKEAIHNAVKYTPTGALVQVSLRVANGALLLDVANDGPPAAIGRATGHGLRNIRMRAEAVGGTATSAPQPGGGWRVAAVLPLR